MQTVDLELLRSLVAFDETGTLARAASRVGRTESAVSLQLRRLEGRVGRPLFARTGRRLALTDDGYAVLHHARRMLALNDEFVSASAPRPITAKLRIAASQDFGEEILPHVLKNLSSRFPQATFEVDVGGGVRGLHALDRGRTDVVLTIGLHNHPSAHRLQRVRLAWIASPGFPAPTRRPVPLVVFRQPCRFKHRALRVLTAAGIPWQITFKSPSLSGLWAATRAGLGLTVRSSFWVPAGLAVLDADRAGLPDLGQTDVDIHYFADRLAPDALAMVRHIERLVVSGW